jgi:hypothetical protein
MLNPNRRSKRGRKPILTAAQKASVVRNILGTVIILGFVAGEFL